MDNPIKVILNERFERSNILNALEKATEKFGWTPGDREEKTQWTYHPTTRFGNEHISTQLDLLKAEETKNLFHVLATIILPTEEVGYPTDFLLERSEPYAITNKEIKDYLDRVFQLLQDEYTAVHR